MCELIKGFCLNQWWDKISDLIHLILTFILLSNPWHLTQPKHVLEAGFQVKCYGNKIPTLIQKNYHPQSSFYGVSMKQVLHCHRILKTVKPVDRSY